MRYTFLGKHNYEHISTYPFYEFYEEWKTDSKEYKKGIVDISTITPNPIIIENDVWIASNVTIKEGVRVGNGAVIAMESLVTKNVPPYAIVGGNPARIIRYRFNKKQIEELLKIAWWNWNDGEIKKITHLLISEKVDAFIEATKKMIK